MIKYLTIVSSSMLLSSGVVAAQTTQLPQPLNDAITTLAAESSDQWAYTRETRDDIGHYTERFDPASSRDQQWQLLAFEGQEPTTKHLKRYRREYESLFDRDSPTDVDLTTLMNPDTVALISERGDILEYSFQPLADSAEDIVVVENLSGKIVIDKRRNSVLSVDIQNTQAFSPESMVKIKTLTMNLKFEGIANGRSYFVSASSSTSAGRFMGIKKFEESESVRYRDFVDRGSE